MTLSQTQLLVSKQKTETQKANIVDKLAGKCAMNECFSEKLYILIMLSRFKEYKK